MITAQTPGETGGAVRVLMAAALLLTLGLACGGEGNREEIVVFAAASLAGPIDEIEAEFERAYPEHDVIVSLAGSQQLRSQIELGADPDVFVSAEESFVTDLVRQGLVAGPIAEIARNRVAVLVAPGNPGDVMSLEDLARSGVRIAIAAAEVPAGKSARRTLENLARDARFGHGYVERVMANVISEEANERTVVVRVLTGEADAALAYVSDASPPGEGGLTEVPLTANAAAEVRYVAAAIPAGGGTAAARFVRFLTSTAAQRIFAARGFLPARD